MPRGYSVRQAVNESAIYSALVHATKGYGGLVKFSRQTGVCYEYLQMMLCGSRRISVEVAGKLGWELRWVKVRKDANQNISQGAI